MSPSIKPSSSDALTAACGSSHGCGRWCGCGGEFGRKIAFALMMVLVVYSIVFLGTLIRNNLKKFNYIGRADRMERTIVVNGMGKASAANDIAMTTIGFTNTDKDVASAQLANKKVMDPLVAELKKMGVADKDIKSNYSIYPDYNYTQDKGQELKGYRVSSDVTVKIRDLSKISQVLGLAGRFNANQVSGLSFTIDDMENVKAEARKKALADAKVKAMELARVLGVRLVSVVGFNEYEGSENPIFPYANGGMAFKEMAAPSIAPAEVAGGSRDAVMNVSVTYEIVAE